MAKTPASRSEPSNTDPSDNEPSSNQSANGSPGTPEPTEQLPLGSAPMSASAAASGGATGLPEPKNTKPSILRRHPLAAGIAAGAVAVVLVSGLTAWGVGTAVTASLTSSASGMPMGTATGAPAPAGMGAGGGGTATSTGRLAFRATIQSMDSGSWTILTRKGKTVTVTVDSTTQFGTKTASETAGSFAVGDSVVIIAKRGTDGRPTAVRVIGRTDAVPSMSPTPAA